MSRSWAGTGVEGVGDAGEGDEKAVGDDLVEVLEVGGAGAALEAGYGFGGGWHVLGKGVGGQRVTSRELRNQVSSDHGHYDDPAPEFV